MDDTHDFQKKNFDNDMGINAHVERKDIEGLQMRRANMALGDIANFIKCDCDVPQLKEAIYAGSAAVHVYIMPALEQALFITQTDPMGRTHEYTASEALKQLQGDLREHYGRKRVVRRSKA